MSTTSAPHCDSHQSKLTRSHGMRWLFGAGAVAILFSFFLFSIDNYLSNPDRARRHDEKLKEIRSAQTSIASSSVDPRVHLGEASHGHE